jgi:Holliday junction resolvase-like predicted endonuclease
MAEIHRIGKETENRALDWYLLHRPCVLLKRNYRFQRGEVDLIFEENIPVLLGDSFSFQSHNSPWDLAFSGQPSRTHTELVFVEVRYRPKLGMVSAVESVGWVKQIRMKRAAEHFLASYRGRAETVRYDLLVWDGHHWGHFPNLQLVH